MKKLVTEVIRKIASFFLTLQALNGEDFNLFKLLHSLKIALTFL